jgi:hypothetical protein
MSQAASEGDVGVLAQPPNTSPVTNAIDPRVVKLLNLTEIPRVLKIQFGAPNFRARALPNAW